MFEEKQIRSIYDNWGNSDVFIETYGDKSRVRKEYDEEWILFDLLFSNLKDKNSIDAMSILSLYKFQQSAISTEFPQLVELKKSIHTIQWYPIDQILINILDFKNSSLSEAYQKNSKQEIIKKIINYPRYNIWRVSI